ncbi:MAG: ABC transporter substrate-binding protein, partial [Alphaproteobacteria bacterium]
MRAAVLAACLGTFLAALPASGPGWAGEPATASPGIAPRRIASINLCADQLVLRLADRERIVSVSSLARDPRISNTAAEAGSVPVNRRSAEEIVRLAPDLVVSGRFGPRKTNEALRRLGIPVFELDVAESIADVRRTIRELAAALGVRARGEDMIRGIDDALAALPQP